MTSLQEQRPGGLAPEEAAGQEPRTTAGNGAAPTAAMPSAPPREAVRGRLQPVGAAGRSRWLEVAYYLALVVLSAGFRLWDLGPRAYHHDESLHAYYSWVLYTGGGFMHNPLMHGPFLFDITAVGFFLFGDNLAAPRVFSALFGIALVLMPLLLRERLGRLGTMAACGLIAISPSLFYFSRFIREDIFTLVFELGAVACIWRYIDTRRNRWLYGLAAFLALLFSTKETSYITLAVLGSFLFMWHSQRWLPLLAARRGAARGPRLKAGLRFAKDPRFALVIVLGTLVLPLASALAGFLVHRLAGGPVLVNSAETWHLGAVGAPVGAGATPLAAVIAGIMFAISGAIGYAFGGRVWLIVFATFYGIFFFLHTTAFTNMVGIGSGVWQGLGYWIAQQSVERGSQPWYYYFILLPLYETLPLSLALAATAGALRRLGGRLLSQLLLISVIAGLLAASVWLTTGTKALYAPLTVALVLATWLALRRGGDPFEWFLIYWTGMNVLLFIVAGEKMPWLITHLVLPMTLLGGRWAGRAFAGLEWPRAIALGGLLALALVPALLMAVRAMVISAKWQHLPLGMWSFAGPLAAGFGILLLGVWLGTRLGRRPFFQLAGISAVAVLAMFTLRAGHQAAFANGDVPREMLVYTQTSPEIAEVMKKIDLLAEQTGKGKDLPVLIDTADGFGWPWYWYLRNYKRVNYVELTGGSAVIEADVVVLNARNRGSIADNAIEYSEGQTIPFRQWFPESYRDYTLRMAWDDLTSGDAWSRALNYYTYRKLGEPLGHIDSIVYYSRALPDGA